MGAHDPLEDVIAVPPTPFLADGGLDLPGLDRLLKHGMSRGLRVFTVAGNTGEFGALTPDEVLQLAEVSVQAAAGAAAVIVGVGGDVATATANARRIAALGANGVMVHEPSGPFRSSRGWLRYHVAVADAAPDVGIVPYVRDPAVSAADLRALCEAAPNVATIKYAVPDPVRFAGIVSDVEVGRPILWACGLAELWAPSFWVGGARAFTSGLAVVEPSLSLALLDDLRHGRWEAVRHGCARARPFEALRARRGGALNVPTVKEALAQRSLIGRTVRPPISELEPDECDEVTRILAGWEAGTLLVT